MKAHLFESFLKLIDILSLTKLAQNLLADGPHKLEKTSRRIRALYDNLYIFDTTEYVLSDLEFVFSMSQASSFPKMNKIKCELGL